MTLKLLDMAKVCLQPCCSASKLAMNRSVVLVFINLHYADCALLYSMDFVSVTKS